MPFYKWAFRGAEDCQVLRPVVGKLKALAGISETEENFRGKERRIEEICLDVGGISAEVRIHDQQREFFGCSWRRGL